MIDSHDEPLIVILSCGHPGSLQDPKSFTPHRVVLCEDGWTVRTEGTWCAACVAAGRAPDGMSRREAWDEVERRRSRRPTSRHP